MTPSTPQLRKGQAGQPTSNGGHFASASQRPDADTMLSEEPNPGLTHFGAGGRSVEQIIEDKALGIDWLEEESATIKDAWFARPELREQLAREFPIEVDEVHREMEAEEEEGEGSPHAPEQQDPPAPIAPGTDVLNPRYTHFGAEGRTVEQIIEDKAKGIDWLDGESATIKQAWLNQPALRDRLAKEFPIEIDEVYRDLAAAQAEHGLYTPAPRAWQMKVKSASGWVNLLEPVSDPSERSTQRDMYRARHGKDTVLFVPVY